MILKFHGSMGPWVQGSKGPRLQGSKGPRVQGSKGPRYQIFKNLKKQQLQLPCLLHNKQLIFSADKLCKCSILTLDLNCYCKSNASGCLLLSQKRFYEESSKSFFAFAKYKDMCIYMCCQSHK